MAGEEENWSEVASILEPWPRDDVPLSESASLSLSGDGDAGLWRELAESLTTKGGDS